MSCVQNFINSNKGEDLGRLASIMKRIRITKRKRKKEIPKNKSLSLTNGAMAIGDMTMLPTYSHTTLVTCKKIL